MFLVECVGYGSVCDFIINESEHVLKCSGPPILFDNLQTCLAFWYLLNNLIPEEKFLILKSSGTPVDK